MRVAWQRCFVRAFGGTPPIAVGFPKRSPIDWLLTWLVWFGVANALASSSAQTQRGDAFTMIMCMAYDKNVADDEVGKGPGSTIAGIWALAQEYSPHGMKEHADVIAWRKCLHR